MINVQYAIRICSDSRLLLFLPDAIHEIRDTVLLFLI